MRLQYILFLVFPFLFGVSCLSKLNQDLARSYGMSEKKILRLKKAPELPNGCSTNKKLNDFFARFRRLDEINTFINERLCLLRKDIGSLDSGCIIEKLGESVENRDIFGIRLKSFKSSDEDAILVTATLHGREWISTTSSLLVALRIDASRDIIIIPVVNPDGYVYTWSGETNIKQRYFKGQYEEIKVPARLYRKNRKVNFDGSIGVDLNRNFGTRGKTWGVSTKSKSINLTGSDIYQGSEAFSEPETQLLKFITNRFKISGVLDLHCCIPGVLEPVSMTNKNMFRIEEGGKRIIEAMNKKAPWDDKYSWIPREEASTTGSGLSSGFYFEDQQIPYVYVIELRGKFVLSCNMIKPIGAEALEAANELLKLVDEYDKMDVETQSNIDTITNPKTITTSTESISYSKLMFVSLTVFMVFYGFKKEKKTRNIE